MSEPATAPAFDPFQLESALEPLEELGRPMWLPAMVNSEGSFYERLASLEHWRERLLAGRNPLGSAAGSGQFTDSWPGEDLAIVLQPLLDQLELARLTHAHEALTEQVMRSLLWHIDRLALAQGHVGRAEAIDLVARSFEADWDEPRIDLKEILHVFESLDGVQNFAAFSELRGLLQTEAWQAVLDAHRAIASLPKLARLIRQLGRARPGDDEVESATATINASVRSRGWVRQMADVALPGAGYETEGVRRSDDLSRLLASEAMQLRRPASAVGQKRAKRLRRLFAARLVEQSLLTYQQRDRWIEPTWVLSDQVSLQPRPRPRPRLQAGPLIICIDTSSSMAGGPEAVGKAVVLEAMKIAHRERRDCRVYAFSGPGDLTSFDLPMSVGGISRIAGFLAGSFHGGTDIVEPIEQALDDIQTSRWQRADLIIASDGEFGATRETRGRLMGIKSSQQLRVQGILVGDRETMGLREVCDDIFWVQDWRRFGQRHGQTETAVHDRNLTGIYFPNARL
ncbi:MAG: VWA domain-containing protein [Burkholderiaceae bacterium]